MDLKEEKLFRNSKQRRRHPWELARAEIMVSIINKHLNVTKYNPTFLDIGCGDVFILDKISKTWPDSKFIGIDTGFNKETLNYYSRKHPNINLYKSFKDMANAVVVSVDIVLMLDVLEHVQNDADMVNEIIQNPAINNNTSFLIFVPAFQFAFSSHDKWLKHYRRYNISLLSLKAEQSGLRIIEAGYFFFFLLVLRMLKVCCEMLGWSSFTDNKGVGEWRGNDFSGTIIKTLLLWDYKISSFINKIGLRVPGLSCYALCQKREL